VIKQRLQDDWGYLIEHAGKGETDGQLAEWFSSEEISFLRLYEDHLRTLEAVEKLREFVGEAVDWSEPYPDDIFTAPTLKQIDDVCKTLGFRIDRISGMVLREFTDRWSGKARALLAATDPATI